MRPQPHPRQGVRRALHIDDVYLDLPTLPLDFLQAYPYPAIVIPVGVPSENKASASPFEVQFTSAKNARLRPFEAVWTNAKWQRLADGRQVLECLSLSQARWLGDWLSGARRQHLPSPAHGPLATEGKAPYRGRNVDDEPTLVLEFSFTSGTESFELTKTVMPVHWNTGSRMTTHMYCVITMIPSLPQTTPPSPVPGTPGSQAPPGVPVETQLISPPLSDDTPLREDMAGDKYLAVTSDWKPAVPAYFQRDGSATQKHDPPAATSDAGRPYDVRRLFEVMDWSKTPLGPREQWSCSLPVLITILMDNPMDCCLWWGKEFTQIYNQQYADQYADHPAAFGRSGTASYAEIWSALGPLTEVVLNGNSMHKDDDFMLHRVPNEERTYEAYRTQMWIPIRDEDGGFGGVWCGMMDTTAKVLSGRRSEMVRLMAERTSVGRTLEDFDNGVLETVQANPKDTPFALLYHVEHSSPAHSKLTPRPAPTHGATPTTRVRLRYAGGVGIPPDDPSAPASLSLDVPVPMETVDAVMASAFTKPFPNGVPQVGHVPIRPGQAYEPASEAGAAALLMRQSLAAGSTLANETTVDGQPTCWPFVEALTTHRTVFVADCAELIKHYPIRAWDELPRSAVVVPIIRDSDPGMPGAVLVLGVNVRSPFNEEYEAFIHSLRIQMASYLVAVRSYRQDQERIRQLASLDRAKSLLFSNVSHELLTPITLVAGPLDDLIADHPEEGGVHDKLTMARRNVRRLSSLVSMLMDVSNFECGRGRGTFILTNLGVVTRDVAALFRKALEKQGIEYVVDCDLEPYDVYVDREKWEKILFTLIGNAIKHVREGFVHVTLKYTDAGQAVFTIQDSGIGIPKSYVEHIGELLYQDEMDTVPAGTGIALSLTKKLIEMHHGTMEVESTTADESPDGLHGTTFRITLLRGRAHLPLDSVLAHPKSPILNPRPHGWDTETLDSGSGPGNDMAAYQRSWGVDPTTLYFVPTDVILLVDDLADTRRYMRSIFEPFCTVIEARDGQEALEVWKECAPDLVIADVIMPRLNGFGLLSALRKGSKAQQMVPFIMLTGVDDARPDDALAADDYLSKPFNARELLARGHMQLQLGKKRRALEARFEERTSELRALTEQSPMGIFRCTPEGYVTYVNAAWYDISGYPKTGDVTNWGDYISSTQQASVRAKWEMFLLNHDVHQTTEEWQWINGNWMSCQIIKLQSTHRGAPSGFVGCCIDITERKLNEELQRQRVKEAEQRRMEAEEAKMQQELLIDITSHEIRNPISSLMQCASLVKTNLSSLHLEMAKLLKTGGAFSPTEQVLVTMNEDLEALDSIYQCALTQERISNDVLSLGKIQLDLFQMFDVETNIRKEAQKVLSVFQNEARMKGIELYLHITDSFDRLGVTTIMLDPVRLGQVLTNLLANAIRFVANSEVRQIHLNLDIGTAAPEGSTCAKPPPTEPHRRVQIGTPLYLFASVSDTGPGLTSGELETLFQRFTQGSAKTHTVFGGSGLGLFVCRKITERMGGRIEVVSKYGHGSNFRFFIRTRPCLAPVPKEASEAAPGPWRPRAGAPPLRVLVVEDNFINRTVLVRQLKHVGLVTESVQNGLEALEILRTVMVPNGHDAAVARRFDVVLMDLEMPVMDGYTATRLLREDEVAGKLLPSNVIALTGNARQAQLDEAMADFDCVVIKPYRLDDLLRKVQDVVKKRTADRGHPASRPVSRGDSSSGWRALSDDMIPSKRLGSLGLNGEEEREGDAASRESGGEEGKPTLDAVGRTQSE